MKKSKTRPETADQHAGRAMPDDAEPVTGDPEHDNQPQAGSAPPVDGTDDTAAASSADDATPEAAETVPLERLLRLQADFENYRKRMVRERADHIDRATEDLILELLPVMDHFDIALRHAEEQATDQAIVEGFRLVADQLATALRKFGLQSIDAEDLPFDPHQHEAVAHLPDAEREEGMVAVQTRRGFRLGGKLLRAAQVVVSSGAPAEDQTDEVQED